MLYIQREAENAVRRGMERFPSVTIYGPRQCGKTTLARHIYPNFTYVNLENMADGVLARNDPAGFFEKYHEPMIIDEIQEAPNLVSMLQYRMDTIARPGMFVLTGSRQADLRKAVSQSLVGRTSLVWLSPLSMGEMRMAGIAPKRDELIFAGQFPGVYQKATEVESYYRDYVNLYLQRDVLGRNLADMDSFYKFMQLLAGRTGQLLDYVDISDAIGVSGKTIKSWVSLLVESHLVHILRPWFSSREKRLVKTPKAYFCDTGLVCSLLGITSPLQVANDRLIGSLFETLVVNEAFKSGLDPNQLFFYRTSHGVEVDLVVRDGVELHPYEIKSACSMNERFGTPMMRFQEQYPQECKERTVIYSGDDVPSFKGVRYVNFLSCGECFKRKEEPFVMDVTKLDK